jgi:hypothetical protein
MAHSSIERTTTESWSTAEVATAGPCTSTSAPGVPATATTKTTTTESSSTSTVASRPSGVS